MPSPYTRQTRGDPYDTSMENLRKAYARRKKLGAYPRPWRSPQEMLMVRRLALWWWTCRDRNKPTLRAWARELGISHVWLLKLIRRFKTDPAEVGRLQAYGDPKLEQLYRARELTRRMREHGDLRTPYRRADKGLGNRVKEAVLAHLAERPPGATARRNEASKDGEYTLAIVEINRENRIKAQQGAFGLSRNACGRKLGSSMPLPLQCHAKLI